MVEDQLCEMIQSIFPYEELDIAQHHQLAPIFFSLEKDLFDAIWEMKVQQNVLGFDDAEWGDGVWPLDLTGDGRSELVTRSTFGTGVPYVFVYRWNAAEGISQHSGIDWEKADAQLAKLSAPLGSVARAETYHAEDNTVTLTLYTEGGTREVTLPLTTDILGEWHAND